MPNSPELPDASTRRRIGPWHPDRLPALDDFEVDTNFLVRAAAGSGKTTALVARMVALVRQGVPVDTCAAITFTRKAASEMRARLYTELRRAQEQLSADPEASSTERHRVTEALEALPRCFIGTIHSFCARLLREHPLAAGLPPDFTAGIDDREKEELRRQVWQSYLSDIWNRAPDKVNHVVSLGIEPADLVHFFGQLCRYPDLTPYVEGPDTPPDLEATIETLREKVDEWSPALPADPADGDAKPGTAAKALRNARRLLRVSPLNDPASRAKFVALFDGITKTDSRKSTETTVRGDITKGHWEDEPLAKQLDNELLPALEREVVAPALRQWRAYAHRQLVDFVQPAVSRFAEHRRQTGQLTFQDLLVHTRSLLRDHPGARRSLQEQYPRLLVDEFQDTDPIQAEILFYLASRDPTERNWRQCRPRDGSLFIVGDDKQSIYRFRRADLDVYTAVRESVDAAPNGEDVTLESNFRSTPPLLEWCNQAFGSLFEQREAPYQARYVPFAAARTDSPDVSPVLQLNVPYVKGASSTRKIARRNADQIARLIAAACRKPDGERPPLLGRSPGDFMVLTRNTTRLDEFSEVFADQGLPFTLAGGDDVQASTELFALVTLLTCLERPQDPVARLSFLRGPLVGLSDDALYRYRSAGGQFRGGLALQPSVANALDPELRERLRRAFDTLRFSQERLDALRPAAAMEQIVDHLGLMVRTRRDPGLGSLHAGRLVRVLTEIQRLDAQGHSWTAIREELQQILDGDRSLDGLTLEAGTADAVRLLNVHKAKGLEAPVVFLADPYGGSHPKAPGEHVRRDEGDVVLPVYEQHRYHRTLRFAPEGWDPSFQDIEAKYQHAEEDRLLYVAATRAEEQLVLSRYRSPSWSKEKGYWAPLYEYLEGGPKIEPPSTPVDAQINRNHIPTLVEQDRRDSVETPTYQVETVTGTPEEDRPRGLEDGYGRTFGTALHRLFEHFIQRRESSFSSETKETLLEAVLSAHDVTEQRETAHRMLDAFLASPLWSRLREANTVHTELPVAGLAEGSPPTITEGTIDLLYKIDGGWHLVDFKTDRVKEDEENALRNRYRGQLQRYATLWEQTTDAPLQKVELWLADLGRSVTIAGEMSAGRP